MKKLNINININKELSFGSEASIRGGVNRNSRLTVGKALVIKLAPVFGVKNETDLLNMLDEKINEAKTKEILFLDSFPRITSGEVKYENIAIIVKFDKGNLVNGMNSITLYCNGVMENREVKELSLELTRIEVMDLNEGIHESSIDISEFSIVNEDLNNNLDLGLLLQEKFRLKRASDFVPFDFKQQGTRLKLSEFSAFVENFTRFLNNKQKEREIVFNAGKTVEFESGTEFTFNVAMRNMNNIKFLEKDAYAVISSTKDPDITFPGFIKSSRRMNKTTLISSWKEDLIEVIDADRELINKARESVAIAKSKLSENEETIRENSSDKKKARAVVKRSERELNQLKDDITSKHKLLKEQHKIIKKKDNNDELILETEIKIAKCEKDIEILEMNINAKEKSLNNAEEILFISSTNLKKAKKDGISLNSIVNREIANERDYARQIKEFERYIVALDRAVVKLDGVEIFEVKMNHVKRDKKRKDKFSMVTSEFDTGNIEWYFSPEWNISSFDYGTLIKYKRYNDSLRNIRNGNYKNPYLALSFIKPSTIEKSKLDHFMNIVTDHRGKGPLNEHQRKAIAKSLATNDVSYIQGPPGTGKTQTLSALSNYSVNNDENILVSSSTHAAIDNFFERLDETYNNNPNIFMLRYIYRSKKDKVNNYGEKDIYDRFLKAVDISYAENRQNPDQGNEGVKETLLNLILSEKNEYDENFFIDEGEIINFDASYIDKTSRIFKHIYNFANEKAMELGMELPGMEVWNANPATVEKWMSYSGALSQTIVSNESFVKFNELKRAARGVDVIFNSEPTIKEIETYLSPIAEIEQDDLYNNFVKYDKERLQFERSNIKPSARDKEPMIREVKAFNAMLISKQLLNVIGITTTARKQITFGGKMIELFVGYNIDKVIIDEVSKSNTPEILSNVFMASKVVLTGDYRQLNPFFDVDSKLLNEFVGTSEFSQLLRFANTLRTEIAIKTNSLNDVDDEAEIREVKTKELISYAERLYEDSLFKNQIDEINRKDRGNVLNSYQYLTEQYRFPAEINNLVNSISYRGDESLVAMKTEFNGHIIRNKEGEALEQKMILLDSSRISSDYINYLRTTRASRKDNAAIEIMEDRMEAFDHNASILTGKVFKSKINEYNAYIICEAINKMVNHDNEDAKNIGVIAMTNSQVKVIEGTLQKFNITGVRVDTVDNFQGREKPVIFVDFVRSQGQYLRNHSSGRKFIVPNHRNLDFYKKVERINVAISRAQDKIIFVGAIIGHLAKGVESILRVDGYNEAINPFLEIYKAVNEQEGQGVVTW